MLRARAKRIAKVFAVVLYFMFIYDMAYKIGWYAVRIAKADEVQETQETEIEVIDLHLVEEETPYIETRPLTINEYENSTSDIETLAEFLWKSPMVYESNKVALLWVVFNRIDDNTGRFANTIEEVCRNKSEFGFMSAHRYHLSEDNLRIAEQELNRWKSLKDCCYIGEHVPRTAVFCGFYDKGNSKIRLYEEIGGEPVWQ